MIDDELREAVEALRAISAEVTEIEAKAARTNVPRNVRETLSAFSNSPGGGILILGLDQGDGFAASGVEDAAKISSDLASMCRNDLEPPVSARIGIHAFEGVSLVVAEVPEIPAAQKPCFVKAAGMNAGTYRRFADGDYRLGSYEVQMLLSARTQPTEDEQHVVDASVSDLDATTVAGLLGRLRRTSAAAFAGLSDEECLMRVRALARSASGTPVPTLAGLLALGRHPQAFFPQMNVTFVRYPTVEGADLSTGERFADNRSFDGPIPVLLHDVMDAIRRNMTRRSVVQSASRRDIWEYPEAALREALANALVHRDLSEYSRGTQVQVEMYPDRLVVRNPGGLYGPVTLDRLGEEAVSSARNTWLLRLLEDVELPDGGPVCENRGSGIKVMLQALRAAHMSPPRFKDSLSSFEVTFPNHTLLSEAALAWIESLKQESLTETQCVALALLREGETLTNSTYRQSTWVDSRVATFELQDLVQRRLVDQTGVRRWASYKLRPEFSRSSSRSRSANQRQAVLRALGNEVCSRAEIAQKLAWTDRTARHWLQTLRAEGKIRMVGGPTQSTNVRYQAVEPFVGDGKQMALPLPDEPASGD